LPAGLPDDRLAAALVDAEFCGWDDPDVQWDSYDRVVLRSVFDYQDRADEFLAWCDSMGAERLRNPPELVAFAADKRYLADLSVPTIPTSFIASGERLPELHGEFVVKPNVSAGARATGRFSSASRDAGAALVRRIHSQGRIALVQPYLADVDDRGETALVYFDGKLSHALRKRAVLRPDEVAPVSHEALGGVALAMLDDNLVATGEADAAEQELAGQLVDELRERFGTPLYLRVDLVRDAEANPVLLELEAIDPVLYLAAQAGAAQRFAAAIRSS
jgi:hypothetical protein